MPRIAVVGGGIVGCLAALLAAERGWDVAIYESESELWTMSSAANEGKVHLGPVFALGDSATWDVMQLGALGFASNVERAVGRRVDWSALATERFQYLVMPGSLATPAELRSRYR